MEKKVDGLVKQMGTLTGSFKFMKTITIASIVALVVTVLGSAYINAMKETERLKQIYVVDQGSIASASARDVSLTKEDEIRDHVMRFHELLFNIPPNQQMIERNLDKALDLSDSGTMSFYNDLQEGDFYKRLIRSNAFQQIDFGKISINMERYPYPVRVEGALYITRESNITKYDFASEMYVSNSVRSSSNLHGLCITKFNVVKKNQVETRNK